MGFKRNYQINDNSSGDNSNYHINSSSNNSNVHSNVHNTNNKNNTHNDTSGGIVIDEDENYSVGDRCATCCARYPYLILLLCFVLVGTSVLICWLLGISAIDAIELDAQVWAGST